MKEDPQGLVEEFVISFCDMELGITLDKSSLSEETSIEDDLGITERTAEEFMDDFVHEFDLDPVDFRLSDYFAMEPVEEEEEDFATPVRRFLFGEREYTFVAKKDRKKLTLGMLAQALTNGSLSW